MDRSSVRNDGAASPLPLMLHWLFGVVVVMYALAMSMPAHAGGGNFFPGDQPRPEITRWVGSGADHARMQAQVNARMFGLGTYHVVPYNVSTATLGKLVNGAVKRGLPIVGWGLTLKSIIDGAGWVIDELGQQVSTPGVPQEQLGSVAYCVIQQPGGQYRCASAPGQLAALAHLASGSLYRQPCTAGPLVGGNASYRCTRVDTGATAVSAVEATVSRPTGGWTGSHTNDNPGSLPAPVSDAEIGNLVKANEQIVNAISSDPQTGAPIRTQELIDAVNALRQRLEAATGTTPGTDLEPSTDYSESTPSQTDWPAFCTWASKVCEWLYDEAPQPDHPAVPYEERDVEYQEYDSGWGGGSCPAPRYVTALDGEVEISWEGICGFVEYMRPLLIGLSWILAAFMVAGAAQRR